MYVVGAVYAWCVFVCVVCCFVCDARVCVLLVRTFQLFRDEMLSVVRFCFCFYEKTFSQMCYVSISLPFLRRTVLLFCCSLFQTKTLVDCPAPQLITFHRRLRRSLQYPCALQHKTTRRSRAQRQATEKQQNIKTTKQQNSKTVRRKNGKDMET